MLCLRFSKRRVTIEGGSELRHEEPAIAGQKLLDHVPAAVWVVDAVEERAEVGYGQQQLSDQLL